MTHPTARQARDDLADDLPALVELAKDVLYELSLIEYPTKCTAKRRDDAIADVRAGLAAFQRAAKLFVGKARTPRAIKTLLAKGV